MLRQMVFYHELNIYYMLITLYQLIPLCPITNCNFIFRKKEYISKSWSIKIRTYSPFSFQFAVFLPLLYSYFLHEPVNEISTMSLIIFLCLQTKLPLISFREINIYKGISKMSCKIKLKIIPLVTEEMKVMPSFSIICISQNILMTAATLFL